MFWRTEAAFQTSSLATMLDKPVRKSNFTSVVKKWKYCYFFQDVTLTEIMDDEYILQEIKCGNKRLTDL